MYVVYVNEKRVDEYRRQENAEAHAKMARKQGNEAKVREEVDARIARIEQIEMEQQYKDIGEHGEHCGCYFCNPIV